eukprot:403350956
MTRLWIILALATLLNLILAEEANQKPKIIEITQDNFISTLEWHDNLLLVELYSSKSTDHQRPHFRSLNEKVLDALNQIICVGVMDLSQDGDIPQRFARHGHNAILVLKSGFIEKFDEDKFNVKSLMQWLQKHKLGNYTNIDLDELFGDKKRYLRHKHQQQQQKIVYGDIDEQYIPDEDQQDYDYYSNYLHQAKEKKERDVKHIYQEHTQHVHVVHHHDSQKVHFNKDEAPVHASEDYDKEMQEMAVSDQWIDQPQINKNFEDDKLTAYLFGRPVKIFEDEDGEVRQEFRFREEANIPMGRTDLIKLYERLNSNQDEQLGEWDKVQTSGDFELYFKLKGSILSQNFYILKLRKYFDASVDIPRMIRTILNTKVRSEWDTLDIDKLELVNVEDDYMQIVYQKSSSAVSFVSARDFLEKKILMRDGDVYYVYFSSIPDEYLPAEDEDVVRAYGITGFQRYEKLKDGRIFYESIMQNDLNAGGPMFSKIAQAASMSALPSKMTTWMLRFEEAIKKTLKYKDFKYKSQNGATPSNGGPNSIVDDVIRTEF